MQAIEEAQITEIEKTTPKEGKMKGKSCIEEIEHKPRKTLLVLSLKCPLICRLLLNDIESLIPENVKRDGKMKEKFTLEEVSDLADLKDADNVFLIETRKKTPAPILWAVTKDIDAETKKEKYDVMKFVMTGIYTMRELKFLGNPLANSQMITLFSKEFDTTSKGMKRAKEILTKMFNTTKKYNGEPSATNHYVDKIASFFLIEKQIMVRFYHIAKKTQETEKIVAERLRKEAEKQKQLEKEGNAEAIIEAEADEKEKENEEVIDPNIQLNEEMKPWYEVNEIGPRFIIHPRESDLDDNYKDPTKEYAEASTNADSNCAVEE